MKKTIVAISICLVAIFMIVLYYEDQKHAEAFKSAKLKGDMELMKKRLMLHINTIELKFPDSTYVRDMDDNMIDIKKITEENTRFGLYIDRSQCNSCMDTELEYLFEVSKNRNIKEQFFILAGGLNLRDQKLLQQEVKYPIYNIELEEHPEMKILTERRVPFFFILQDGKISSVFYPSDLTRILLEGDYFGNVYRRCSEKNIKKTEYQNTLEFSSPLVDLGKVSVRKKYKVIFKVTNVSSKKCKVYNIMPSCDCIILGENPDEILPGETADFTVYFISTTKGVFSRNISLTTNLQQEPFTLTIIGEVT